MQILRVIRQLVKLIRQIDVTREKGPIHEDFRMTVPPGPKAVKDASRKTYTL